MAELRGVIACVFAALGLLIAYEDFKTHKIRNVRILSGLMICALGYALLFGVRLWAGSGVPPYFFGRAATHALLSVIIALSFWQTDIWPAGDAKLFILAAILLPLIDLNLPRFPHALFLVLLINIFIPCMAFTLLYIVFRYACKWIEGTTSPDWLVLQWRDFFRSKARALAPQDLKMLLGFLALFLAGTAVRFVLLRVSSYWLTVHALFYLLLYLYWDALASLMKDKMGTTLISLSVAYLAVGIVSFPAALGAHLRYAFGMYAGFGGLFMLLRLALETGTKALEGRVIDATAVQAGMVPLDLKLDPSFHWEDFGPLSRDGLSSEQAAQLRAWAQPLPPALRLITVSGDSRAFAGWIICGTALTLLLRTDVLHLGGALARLRF